MPKKRKLVWVTFRMDGAMREEFSRLAYKQGITDSEAMRRAVGLYMEYHAMMEGEPHANVVRDAGNSA